MSFLENIFAQLEKAKDTPILQELAEGGTVSVTGSDLLDMVGRARAFLSKRELPKRSRCVLLANNSIRWVAMDLALMAEGLIVVPLYSRQAPAELVAMMKDCSPSLICCGDAGLRDSIHRIWPDNPDAPLFEEILATPAYAAGNSHTTDDDTVTIIYTSGTSGDAKGVMLNAGNVKYILGCTSGRLEALMSGHQGQERVFHYTPFAFAAAWIMLLTCLSRGSLLVLNTDLSKIATDIPATEPHYFVNVPLLLERVRRVIDEQLLSRGGVALTVYTQAKAAWARRQSGQPHFGDGLRLRVANKLLFPTLRKRVVGTSLKALICGSAPLNVETQLFFAMLGIPVLQVYGLTETTAICTMDDPAHVEPGRVGPPIPGTEMKLDEGDEIVVRGPNIFSGYWNRPDETAKAIRDGWFHTGDQGEMNASGNWRIIGRVKNLVVLASGHKVPPEPIEEDLLQHMAGAQQVVLVGNGRSYLSAIITGEVSADTVQAAIDNVNAGLPHYKQVRAFRIHPQPFTIDDGLLTANGKLKRDTIAARLQAEIDELYRTKQAS